MRLAHTFAAAVVGYSVSLATAWFCLFWLETGAVWRFAALMLGGLIIGAAASRLPWFADRRAQLATCAFLAALTLWLPVVVVTFGFALLGVPFLALYALAVLAGWRLRN
ncbi:MAG TPA: hypothetical protein VFF16_17600 [Telluria sp.]|nr:hypothetical protein [Telluria sp.]